jgi:hypothetical protein
VPETTLCVTCQRELEKIDSRKAMASKTPQSFGVRRETEWEGAEATEDEDHVFMEYHIGSLPTVDIEDAGSEEPASSKEEK